MKTGTLKSVLLLGAAVLVLMSGCGGVYMNVKTPMPTLDMQVNADGQAKMGKASAEMFVWLLRGDGFGAGARPLVRSEVVADEAQQVDCQGQKKSVEHDAQIKRPCMDHGS